MRLFFNFWDGGHKIYKESFGGLSGHFDNFLADKILFSATNRILKKKKKNLDFFCVSFGHFDKKNNLMKLPTSKAITIVFCYDHEKKLLTSIFQRIFSHIF